MAPTRSFSLSALVFAVRAHTTGETEWRGRVIPPTNIDEADELFTFLYGSSRRPGDAAEWRRLAACIAAQHPELDTWGKCTPDLWPVMTDSFDFTGHPFTFSFALELTRLGERLSLRPLSVEELKMVIGA